VTTVGELAVGLRGRPVRGWRLVCPRCGSERVGPGHWLDREREAFVAASMAESPREPDMVGCLGCGWFGTSFADLARGDRNDTAGRYG